ncbi:SDR family oxidoreductase [Nocardioides dubius]|uniref:SDR family oxidoreductase n=1 Tax=Nocardioides dubius TaxID=317019 RepID=A0ABP4EFV1_9ACTN
MSRKIVVTGAASGIGAATVALIRARGDVAIGVDLRDVEVIADLSTPAGRSEAVAKILEATDGQIDGLITCAGLSNNSTMQVNVNFFGTTELVEGLLPAITASGGKVALVASISATQPSDAATVEALLAGDEEAAVEAAGKVERVQAIYPSTKFALVQWMRRNAGTPAFAGAGVPMNAIAPGVVLSPMTDALIADPKMKAIMDAAVPSPLGGYASAAEIGQALLWLVAAENTKMTGQIIFVDSGAEVTLRPADHF